MRVFISPVERAVRSLNVIRRARTDDQSTVNAPALDCSPSGDRRANDNNYANIKSAVPRARKQSLRIGCAGRCRRYSASSLDISTRALRCVSLMRRFVAETLFPFFRCVDAGFLLLGLLAVGGREAPKCDVIRIMKALTHVSNASFADRKVFLQLDVVLLLV